MSGIFQKPALFNLTHWLGMPTYPNAVATPFDWRQPSLDTYSSLSVDEESGEIRFDPAQIKKSYVAIQNNEEQRSLVATHSALREIGVVCFAGHISVTERFCRFLEDEIDLNVSLLDFIADYVTDQDTPIGLDSKEMIQWLVNEAVQKGTALNLIYLLCSVYFESDFLKNVYQCLQNSLIVSHPEAALQMPQKLRAKHHSEVLALPAGTTHDQVRTIVVLRKAIVRKNAFNKGRIRSLHPDEVYTLPIDVIVRVRGVSYPLSAQQGLRFHENGMLYKAHLSQKTSVQNYSLEKDTEVEFDEFGHLMKGTLGADLVVDVLGREIVFHKNYKTLFHKNRRPKWGRLRNDVEFLLHGNPIVFSAHSEFALYENGQICLGWTKNDFTYPVAGHGEVEFWGQGNVVNFYRNYKLQRAFLKQNTTFQVKERPILFEGRGRIWFYENGRVERGFLGEDTELEVNGEMKKFKKGQKVNFDEDGNVNSFSRESFKS